MSSERCGVRSALEWAQRCAVVEPAVSGVVEGFVLVQPDLPLLQLAEPAFDEGLAFGVAVAAAAADAELGEGRLEASRGEVEPLSERSTSSPGSMPYAAAAAFGGHRARRARAPIATCS